MNADAQARRRRIWETVLAIPEGRVASYGQVAEASGLPGRARLVGRAMRELPRGSHVPWYRVLRADGRIAFSAESEAHRLQRDLLREEGVEVRAGRVDLLRFGWNTPG